MLETLTIKNFTIIDFAEIEFQNGFTVLTGETGAGKSIIIDAISVLFGAKVSDDLIKTGTDTAFIEGIFKVPKSPLPQKIKNLIEDDEKIIIHKKISKGKTSSSKLNNQSVTLKTLKELAPYLISISGQHEHISLFSEQKQLQLLDEFGKNKLFELKDKYQAIYKKYLQITSDLESILKTQTDAKQKLDFYNFQIQDIKSQNFTIEEEKNLKQKQKQIKHHQQIQKSLQNLNEHFYQITNHLAKAKQHIQKLTNINLNQYHSLETNFQSLEIESEEFFSQISSQFSEINNISDLDIDAIESRLDTIFKYKTKYQCQSVQDILNILKDLEKKQHTLQTSTFSINNLNREKQALQDQLLQLAKQIHQIRINLAKTLSLEITKHLIDLAFTGVKFEIKIFFDPNHFTSSGADHIDFQISTNPGEPLSSLKNIASGGELSRILLALKTVFYINENIPTIIFDEIDTGIGGLTALKIGEKIKTISTNCQVLCVTHLPQIAKFSNHHFNITKNTTLNKVSTNIKLLTSKEKHQELSRMIGGQEIINIIHKTTS